LASQSSLAPPSPVKAAAPSREWAEEAAAVLAEAEEVGGAAGVGKGTAAAATAGLSVQQLTGPEAWALVFEGQVRDGGGRSACQGPIIIVILVTLAVLTYSHQALRVIVAGVCSSAA
jgi:hypothetical protein